MSWMVTGGAGYIGAHVVRSLLRAGHDVVVFDDRSSGHRRVVPPGVPVVVASTTDAAALTSAMGSHRVHGVIHMAARKSVAESVADPLWYYRQNVDGVLSVVEAMVGAGVGKLVFSSSAAVYGSPAAEVVAEGSPTDPVNPYGASKLAGEWIVRDAAAAHGLECVSLRYFNVAGAAVPLLCDHSRAALVPQIVDRVAKGLPPVVFGGDYPTPDGSCVRDFLHVSDVAEAHTRVAEALERGSCGPVYNLGSGSGYSVLEVVRTLREVSGIDVGVEMAARRPGDPARVIADVVKIRDELGWCARHDLAEMIESEWEARLQTQDAPLPRLSTPVASRLAPRVPSPSQKIVIVSASVGAGHDGAAREWADRLTAAGFEVGTYDLLEMIPAILGRWLRELYEAMLQHAPWTYTMIYALAAHRRLGAPLVRGVFGRYRKRLAALVTADTVAVISTYPIASQMLSTLRTRGELDVPAITFLTDFSVHPLWVGKGIDAHFALHEISAGQARSLGAQGVVVTGPVVADRFGCSTETCASARVRFGLPATERLGLLVAGSWGVGQVEEAAGDIAASGAVQPVIVCGRNTELRQRLIERGLGHPLGWIDDMPALMRAVDVLVENAGGLTSLEAMASGIPVATYRPIPGHGRANAAALEQAGVSTWIREQAALRACITDLLQGIGGRRQRQQAQDLFAGEPIQEALAVLARSARTPARSPRPTPWVRRAAVAAIAFVLVGLSGTLGTEMAVAKGFSAVHAVKSNKTFVVIHPDPDTPIDAQTISSLRSIDAGVALDRAFIAQQPAAVRALAGAGVVILNAGGGPPYRTGLIHGRSMIAGNARETARLAGARPQFYLSSRSVDALDVFKVRRSGEEIVQPGLQITDDDQPSRLRKGQIVLVECAGDSDCDPPAILGRLRQQPVTFGSLAELRR